MSLVRILIKHQQVWGIVQEKDYRVGNKTPSPVSLAATTRQLPIPQYSFLWGGSYSERQDSFLNVPWLSVMHSSLYCLKFPTKKINILNWIGLVAKIDHRLSCWEGTWAPKVPHVSPQPLMRTGSQPPSLCSACWTAIFSSFRLSYEVTKYILCTPHRARSYPGFKTLVRRQDSYA